MQRKKNNLMCGITGFIEPQRTHDDAEHLIDGMCQLIRHRGPDGQGTWVGDGVALGMRRLAIIDVAGGQQPIFNEDQSILVVFNGEIYNYSQLQETLRQRGHSFRTRADTEVIVHAYEEYGDACVQYLRGMFTFALWDRKRQRLLAARDRFGKKPFNYSWDGNRLVFGSEIKSILEAGIAREINPLALDEYLMYGYVPTPNSLFQHVFKLPAAHILVYEDGQISVKRYWDLPFTPTCQDDEATTIERTRVLLRDAVQVRLMSEVPLGVFLSGGIDSSMVVGLMSSMTSQPVKTFSIAFEEDGYNETIYARQVAAYFGTDHHEFVVRPNLVSVLPKLAWAYDEPFADPSMLPTYYVSNLAREHVTVALTGDGGDEIFGGYVRYARETAIQRVPTLGRTLFSYGSRLMPDGMRGKKRLGHMSLDLPTRYVHALAYLTESSRPSLYHPDYFAQVCHQRPSDRQINEFMQVSKLDSMAQMQYVDVHTYLTDDILVKVDKASMLNSLETRAPLLDHYLVEYVASLPSTIRTRDNTLKYLLKKAVADVVPAEVLTRPKQGFGVPLQHWFRGDLASYARDLLDSPRVRQRGIFQPAFIRRLLQEHASTRLINHSNAIWALLALELWFQVYIDQPPRLIEELRPTQLTGQ
jgi:asparagine synthase (glutamine-hydrolysing)